MYGGVVHSTGDRFESNAITVADGEPGQPPEGGALGVRGEAAMSPVPAEPGVFVGTDDLFRGNSVAAGGWGGAIYAGFNVVYCYTGCPGSSVTLQDSTVVGNRVEPGLGSQGGALWGGPADHVVVENSIVYGNTAQPQIFGFGGSAAFGYSDVCNEPGGLSISGEGLICTNPLLNELDEETASSPTIGTGSVGLVPAGLGIDLVGGPRTSTSTCGRQVVDMGAFEWQGARPCAIVPASTPLASPAVVSDARETHKTWREGSQLAQITRRKHKRRPPVGTTFSFTLNEQAPVTFTFTEKASGRTVRHKCVAGTRKNRKRKRCARTVAAGTITFTGHRGVNRVVFEGRISRSKKLKPGRYKLAIVATSSAGQRSAPASLGFTIVK